MLDSSFVENPENHQLILTLYKFGSQTSTRGRSNVVKLLRLRYLFRFLSFIKLWHIVRPLQIFIFAIFLPWCCCALALSCISKYVFVLSWLLLLLLTLLLLLLLLLPLLLLLLLLLVVDPALNILSLDHSLRHQRAAIDCSLSCKPRLGRVIIVPSKSMLL